MQNQQFSAFFVNSTNFVFAKKFVFSRNRRSIRLSRAKYVSVLSLSERQAVFCSRTVNPVYSYTLCIPPCVRMESYRNNTVNMTTAAGVRREFAPLFPRRFLHFRSALFIQIVKAARFLSLRRGRAFFHPSLLTGAAGRSPAAAGSIARHKAAQAPRQK